MRRFVVGVCAAAGFAVAAGADAQAACSRVSVKGEGVTKEIAREMAKINLDFAVSSKGAKAAGPVAYKCGAPGVLLLTSCTAKQRACT
ncbi:MAG: hypothetical protein K2X43_18825 [Hyphomonadaceae bacterium]|nr:hypothetical protein [Hyphomonadaceae bacterium]